MKSMKDNQLNPFEAFYAYLMQHDLSERTKSAYLIDLIQFKEFFERTSGETLSITAVTEYDCIAWRDEMERMYKPASINRKLSSLHAWMRWATKNGLTTSDKTKYVHGVKTQSSAPKSLEPHQITKIMRTAAKNESPRDIALLELLFATGLRAGEIVKLKIEDVEIRERSGWIIVHGKGRKIRRVPLNKRVRRVLSDYIGERTSGALFLTEHGYVRGISYQTVRRIVKKYSHDAGITINVTPHSARHTVATKLVRDPQTDLITVAKLLGHARLETIMIYAQPSDDDLADAVDRL